MTALRIAEPTGMCRRDLRRFTYKDRCATPCSRDWGHDAHVTIETVPDGKADPHGDNWPHDDVRWPATCQHCGYAFTSTDQWQRNDNRLYRLPDGPEFTLWGGDPPAPAGTMVRIGYYDEHSTHPDGVESWLIFLPDGGSWITSQAAKGGGYWTVTGTPPLITVSPSIWHNQPEGWHGFIRNGEMIPA